MRGTPGRLWARSRALRIELARLAISVVAAVALGGLVWSLRPTGLSAPIDIVGYPSFVNFNYRTIIWGWRIAVWLVPLAAIVCYLLLMRFGPLRSSVELRLRPASAATVDDLTSAVDRVARSERRRATAARWAATLAVPGLLVAVAVSAASVGPGGSFTLSGLIAAASYALVVVGVSLVAARREAGLTERPFSLALAKTSAVSGEVLAPTVLFVVSQRTLAVDTAGRTTSWTWLPWWLAALLVMAGLLWVLRVLRRGGDAIDLERSIRTLVHGSVATFVAVAALPPVMVRVEGFDDSLSVVGADLLARGYLPWGDVLFIHGLFEDALRSSIGFGLFEPTYWGASAARYILITPVAWVLLYLLALWASSRRSVLPVGVVVLAASSWLPLSERWVGLVVGIVLLGEVVRREDWRWTALLTTWLFVGAVLVPEMSFQVIATFVVILLSDLVRRPRGRTWWAALPTARAFVATGLVLSTLLLVGLAVAGALSSFIDYYRYFGPGHFESGTIPVGFKTNDLLDPRDFFDVDTFDRVAIVVIGASVVCTLFLVAWRWAHRRVLTPLHWCMLCASIMAGLYGEKALGRFDLGHVVQSLTVAMPLLVMWAALIVHTLECWIRPRPRRPPAAPALRRRAWSWTSRVLSWAARALSWLGQPVALAAIAVLVLSVPHLQERAGETPGRTRLSVDGARLPKIGYVDPTALNLDLLDDARKVLDTYAGPDGTVFDFTNSPGYFYFLLGRDMPTPFVAISLAVAELAQEGVIEDLEKSQPPVVVFDNTTFGLAAWDGPRPEVRHYRIAQYILDHWTPVLDAGGVLYLARNDLVTNEPPPPGIGVPVAASELYFYPPDCDWGYAADYVESPPSGRRVELPVRTEPGFRTEMVGWAYDTEADAPVSEVLVVSGDRVVGHLSTGGNRSDVAASLGLPGAASSGFAGSFVFTGDQEAGVTLYAVVGDGKAYAITPPAGYLPPDRLRDGSRSVPVGRTGRLVGWADGLDGAPTSVGIVDVPADADLRDYELATFEADGPIGRAHVVLTDRLDVSGGPNGNNRRVIFGSLPVAGDALSVRVGSCLQWHGFAGHHLYLIQDDGRPIDEVVLSDVAD